MSPLGKLTLAMLGLKFFGANGLFLGLFLGHILIDKTFLIRWLENYMNHLDDIIRIKLPYNYYRYYNRLDGNIWGKLWGSIFGGLLYGFWGFVIFFILGQLLFDMPTNPDIRRFKKNTDHFFDNNWGKILGAIIGFVLKSPVLIFVGVIGGFIVDYQRLEGAKLIPIHVLSCYWQKINPLKLWRHAESGEHRKYLEVMAALAALVVEADGVIKEKEKKVFRQLFAVKDEATSEVWKIFTTKTKHQKSLDKYADLLEKLTRDNDDLKDSSLENLFKIAAADCDINEAEMKILDHVAKVINLDEAAFTVLKRKFTPVKIDKKLAKWYEILGVEHDADMKEIKDKWKKLIMIYHPDKMIGASDKEIKTATKKMAEINIAYQEIVKAKSKK
ncbi:MAG: TerB family tellurite resistance protein [Alphaproteobacteria bacterium]|nr:TerB family tellurite resistance protein [Alphaproteobacteria bacterium]